MQIYTKTGDKGQTSLWSGERLDKCHPRICLLGEMDELTSILGVAKCHLSNKEAKESIHKIQEHLISVMGELADHKPSVGATTVEHIEALEKDVDRYMADNPFTGFTVPGESMETAYLELARVTARKVERRLHEVAKSYEVSDIVKQYINRLSDYLYALTRYVNKLNKA